MTTPCRVADGETGWAERVTGAAYPAGGTSRSSATARTASLLGPERFQVLGRSADLEKRTKAA